MPTNSSQQTSTQSARVPGFMRPVVKDFFQEFRQAFGDPSIGGAVPNRDLIAPFVGAQRSALRDIQDLSKKNPFMDSLMPAMGSIGTNGGLAPGMQGSMDVLRAIANGSNQITTGNQYQGLVNNYGNMVSAAPGFATTGQFQGLVNDLGNYSSVGDYSGFNNQVGGGQFSGVGDFQSLMSRAGTPTASMTNLASMASGDLLSGNPHLEEIVRRSTQKARDAAQLSNAAAGRFGSPQAQAAVADAAAGVEANLRYQDYDTQQARQLQANQMISADQGNVFNQLAAATQGLTGAKTQDYMNQAGALDRLAGARTQDFGNRSSALGQLAGEQNADFMRRMAGLQGQESALAGLTGVQSANITNQANAAAQNANIANMGTQNLLALGALAPSLNNARYTDALRGLAAGTLQQQQRQNVMNSRVGQWQAEQDSPLTRLNAFASLLGAGNPYIGRTSTTPGPSPYATGMGGAISGAMLGNMLVPGYGAVIGGLGGGLAGLYG